MTAFRILSEIAVGFLPEYVSIYFLLARALGPIFLLYIRNIITPVSECVPCILLKFCVVKKTYMFYFVFYSYMFGDRL